MILKNLMILPSFSFPHQPHSQKRNIAYDALSRKFVFELPYLLYQRSRNERNSQRLHLAKENIDSHQNEESTAKVPDAAATEARFCDGLDAIEPAGTKGDSFLPKNDALAAALSVVRNMIERAKKILSAEPVLKQELSSARTEGDASLPKNDASLWSGFAAHGTNLAAALPVVRNTQGYLLPIDRLGFLWSTGAIPEAYLAGWFWKRNPLRNVVFGTDLAFFGARAMRRRSGVRAGKRESSPSWKDQGESLRIRRRPSSRRFHRRADGPAWHRRKAQRAVPEFPSRPAHSGGQHAVWKSIEEVREVFADQIIGERLKFG